MITIWKSVLHMRKTTNLDDIGIFFSAAEAGTFSRAIVETLTSWIKPSAWRRSSRCFSQWAIAGSRRQVLRLDVTERRFEHLISFKSGRPSFRDDRSLRCDFCCTL
jgi:hypothetical protein